MELQELCQRTNQIVLGKPPLEVETNTLKPSPFFVKTYCLVWGRGEGKKKGILDPRIQHLAGQWQG